MIKPHILHISSPDKYSLLKQSILSFEHFSGTDFHSTIIVNTPEIKQPFNDTFFKKSNIIYDSQSYKIHPPSRWFIEPKSEVCLFLDYDIITISNINDLIILCHSTQSLCGVIALSPPSEQNIFQLAFEACGVKYYENRNTWLNQIPTPRYYNYGVLAVPSPLVEKIKTPLQKNINIIVKLAKSLKNKELDKFGGQIALAITIEQIKVPTTDLGLRYNFPDSYPELISKHPEEYKNIVFKHLLSKKLTYQKLL